MSIEIVTAEQRNSAAHNKTSLAIFGPPGVGKTSLLNTLPADYTLCIDIEAGMKSVQGWQGASVEIRCFRDFQDLIALIAGPDPSASPASWYSQQHHEHVAKTYAGTQVEQQVKDRPVIFVDSITDLTRLAMAYAQQQPEAISEKTGKPDTRGAYGLLARQVIGALKYLQRARGKTVIFVGVLEKVIDEFNRGSWQPQMEGSKAGRELPGIVDQVCSMHFFSRDQDGEPVFDETSSERLLVCRSGNPFGLPAKDRSGNLDITEPPDLGALLTKINRTQ